MVHFKDTRRQRTSLSVSYLVVSFLSGFPENPVRCLLSGFCPCFLSGVCLSRFCRLSGFGPDLCKKDCPISICPDFRSRFCPLSGFCPDFPKKLSAVCQSRRPDKDRTELSGVRTFAVLVRRRLTDMNKKFEVRRFLRSSAIVYFRLDKYF